MHPEPLVWINPKTASKQEIKDGDWIYIETKNRNIKKTIENIHSKIKVKIGSFDIKSNLIKEIIKDHAIVRGFEEFYEMLKNKE